MISFIRGVVENVGYDSVIIDVSGVGYGVRMHVRDVSSLKKGQKIESHITEIIREQSFDLYGFLEYEDKNFFDVLLKVSGVGPRIALALLGLASREEVAAAINNGDTALISSAPGVGKRLAERIVVELKDKFIGSASTNYLSSNTGRQAEEALLALGFSSNDVKAMIKNIDVALPVEEQIRLALRER